MRGTHMSLSFHSDIIFEDAEFELHQQDKVGIVGVNGAGKTTLFNVLMKRQELDSGKIVFEHHRIGYLPQEIRLMDKHITVWDYLLQGRPIGKLEAKLQQIYDALANESGNVDELLHQMVKIQEKLEYHEHYQAEDILLHIIEKMDIKIDLLNMQLTKLSGGQKSKIAFAQLLYSNPEILLLDEPTNHLDQSTRTFVKQYLKKYNGMVFIISHDINFLNEIINKVLYINKVTHKISIYDGDYTIYEEKLAQERLLRERLILQQENEIKVLSDFVFKARQASQTNHHLKRMGQERALRLNKKRQALQVRERVYKRVKMDINPARESPKTPLEVNGLSFGYPNQPFLYHDLSFALKGKEKFLVVGNNGVGKSTLLKLLMGEITPYQGNIQYHQHTDVAYYAQELEQLDQDKQIIENVTNEGYSEWQLRAMLSNFLFYDNDIYKSVSILSPGEKARVSLCNVLLKKANLLILDEPTNHLDPQTQEIIGANFKMYPGTMIVVSHNPAFIEQIGINRMLVLPSGRIEPYSRELLDYYNGIQIQES